MAAPGKGGNALEGFVLFADTACGLRLSAGTPARCKRQNFGSVASARSAILAQEGGTLKLKQQPAS